MKRILIAGVGERLRADDAAGLLAVDELRSLGADAVEVRDLFNLPELLRDADEAVLIDAVLCDAPAGEVLVMDARLRNNGARFPVSCHGFGLAETLQIAEGLGCLPRDARIVGISARRFDAGQSPSPEVREGARRAARLIAGQIAAGNQSR